VASGERPERGQGGRLVLTPATGLVLVLVPKGSFTRGSTKGARSDEQPLRAVALATFWLSKYEMTQGQWKQATGANPSQYQPPQEAGGRTITELHPVEQVSWDDCEKTLKRLGLRFPSEAEWEYAARAGTETEWWTGDDKRLLKDAANVADQSYVRAGGANAAEEWDDGHAIHAPVGSFRANAFGLHDVIGNVWEWTRDAGDSSYEKAPTDGSAWDSVGASNRVSRGGSWDNDASLCRSARRVSVSPTYRSLGLGVRPAK
jgi:formylglycine-generating enzyme required for sulfatase activity